MKNIIFIVFTLLFLNCNNSETDLLKQTKELSKQKIDLIQTSWTPEQKNLFGQSKWKIISYVRGDCSACLDYLKNWYEFEKNLEKYNNVTLILYIGIEDRALIQPWLRQYSLKNIIIDKDRKFYIQNKLYKYNNNLQTFLLDSLDNIVVIGSPISYPKIWPLYHKAFQNEIKSN